MGTTTRMPDAEIQGELHSSKKDRRTLMELDLSRFDAVFREGREGGYFERDLTVGYTLFAIGHLLYGATYGRLYVSAEKFERHVEESGLPFIKIDAEIHEIFEMVPRWKRTGLLLFSPLYTAFLVGGLIFLITWSIGLTGISIPDWVMIPISLGFLLSYGLAWPLGFFMLVVAETMDDRDEYMAENILEVSNDRGFEEVVVSCGDGHRRGIRSILEDHGWNVDPHPTESLIGKVFIGIDRLAWAVLNPRKSIKRAYSILTRN